MCYVQALEGSTHSGSPRRRQATPGRAAPRSRLRSVEAEHLDAALAPAPAAGRTPNLERRAAPEVLVQDVLLGHQALPDVVQQGAVGRRCDHHGVPYEWVIRRRVRPSTPFGGQGGAFGQGSMPRDTQQNTALLPCVYPAMSPEYTSRLRHSVHAKNLLFMPSVELSALVCADEHAKF